MTGLVPGESVAQLLGLNTASLSGALTTVALVLSNFSGNQHADEGGACQPIRLCQFRGLPFLVGGQCAFNRRNLWIFRALRVTHALGITDPSKTSTANCACACDEEPLLANTCGTSLASAIGCGKRPAARALASAISSHSLSLWNGNFSNPEQLRFLYFFRLLVGFTRQPNGTCADEFDPFRAKFSHAQAIQGV